MGMILERQKNQNPGMEKESTGMGKTERRGWGWGTPLPIFSEIFYLEWGLKASKSLESGFKSLKTP